jgi:predicted nuclease with TOPRIM domain
MKLQDHLSHHEKSKLNQMRKKKRRKKNKSKTTKDPLKEHLSMSDLKQLMGMNRDRYERRGGSIRRK